MSIPGIGPLSAAVIYSEYGDISNFSNPGQMLAFAGIEPGINESGTESHRAEWLSVDHLNSDIH
ncbi:IS110 family transposase [Clostridium sp. SY8519]|uniref:IS110 family transposase n=1 Tax=Clostridium sp. (strain SY8519) TaxID=1042156 RepID=UPI001FA6B08E|nr:IS110 family transposase [Clostridium sp. SY8519]